MCEHALQINFITFWIFFFSFFTLPFVWKVLPVAAKPEVGERGHLVGEPMGMRVEGIRKAWSWTGVPGLIESRVSYRVMQTRCCK